jgi:hypothetical protein
MAKLSLSTKRLQIDKANALVTAVVALASFVCIFSIVASRALLVRRSYQARVIHEKKIANAQLKENIKAVDSLVTSYRTFAEASQNIIGGSSTGTGERDGDNAQLTLDALPSKYDFPALTTSLEKIILSKNFKIEAITGSDDEIAQKDVNSSTEPVEMPFKVSVKGQYDPLQELISLFEHSIRPIQPQVITYTATGNADEVQLDIEAKSYYLPEKVLTITTKEVR